MSLSAPSAASRHYESTASVNAARDEVFAHIDDHTRLSAHMSQSSWMMGGSRMTTELDEDRGKKVGSRIRLAGRVLGMELAVEEVVTERRPPHSKRWQTVGSPKLLVVGHYAMGFRLEPRGEQSELCVFIEYEVPRGPVTRWLGRLLGGVFAQWCVRRMVDDAVQHFASRPKRPAPSTYDPRRRFAMTRLDPWRFGAVVAITVVVSYTLCTLFWFAFNEPSIDSLNALFHGMDFRRIHTTAAFSLGDFGGVLAVFAVWGYTTGVIYAVVRNVLMVRSNT